MNRTTKTMLITGVCLIFIGSIIFGGVCMALNWDLSKLSTVEYVTNTYELKDSYKNISISTNTADIIFVPCDASTASVVCNEIKNANHIVTIEDGTLSIKLNDTRKWYEHVGISFKNTTITVNIPACEYGALSIETNTGKTEIPAQYKFSSIDLRGSTGHISSMASATGDINISTSTGYIRVENATANNINLSAKTGKITANGVTCQGDITLNVSTGNIELSDIRSNSIYENSETGNIYMKNVISKGIFSIETDTGNIKFDGCDASEITVSTDTGSVKGSLLSDKVFIARSDTGHIDVPQTVTGGKCKISTDTGNIKIEID